MNAKESKFPGYDIELRVSESKNDVHNPIEENESLEDPLDSTMSQIYQRYPFD